MIFLPCFSLPSSILTVRNTPSCFIRPPRVHDNTSNVNFVIFLSWNIVFFNPLRGNDNHSNSREVSAFYTIGLKHLPPPPPILGEFRLVRIHQPLRVGHRLILVFKIFKVEIGLGGGKDPLKSVGSIQLILRLGEEEDGDKVQGSQGWQ